MMTSLFISVDNGETFSKYREVEFPQIFTLYYAESLFILNDNEMHNAH